MLSAGNSTTRTHSFHPHDNLVKATLPTAHLAAHLLLHPGHSSSFLEYASFWLTIIISNTTSIITVHSINIHLQNYSSPLVSLFSWASKSPWRVTTVMKLKDTCSLEKSNENLCSVLNSRDITLPTKVHTVKAMVFPGVMYRCESWTIKKAEHQRIDAFELQCWRRLLRVPWTARRLNQSILKEINPELIWVGNHWKDWC